MSVKNRRIEKENQGIWLYGGMSVYFCNNIFDHFINYLVFEGIVKYYNVEFVSILMYLKILKIDLSSSEVDTVVSANFVEWFFVDKLIREIQCSL